MLFEFVCETHPDRIFHTDSDAIETISIMGDPMPTCCICGSLLHKVDITPKMASLEDVKVNKPKRRTKRKAS